MMNQAINLGGFLSGNGLELEDFEERQNKLEAQYLALKERGFFNESEKREENQTGDQEEGQISL